MASVLGHNKKIERATGPNYRTAEAGAACRGLEPDKPACTSTTAAETEKRN